MAKRVDTSHISDPNIRLPFASKTLNWLQTAPKEDIANLVMGLLNNIPTNQVIILWGCGITYAGPTGGTASVNAGAIYYNGIIYAVRANASLSIGAGQIPVWITGTVSDETGAGGSGNDPTIFSDGISQFDVHMTDLFILASGPRGGSGMANYVTNWDDTGIKYLFQLLQADWGQSNPNNPSYIDNKPSLATVATSGDYNDLSSKPSIPTVSTQKGTTNITPSAGGGPISAKWLYENNNGSKKLIISFNGSVNAPNSATISLDCTAIFTAIGGGAFDTTNAAFAAAHIEDTTSTNATTQRQDGWFQVTGGATITINGKDGFNSSDSYYITGQIIAYMS